MIDWSAFTPTAAFIGGLVIGLATALFLLGLGRVAGISGLLAGPWNALLARRHLAPHRESLLFVVGLLLAPWIWRLFAPWPAIELKAGPLLLVIAGLLVGIGVRLGNGCTSGHGVCGLSRLSPRSLANVLAFMSAGMVTVFVMRHLA